MEGVDVGTKQETPFAVTKTHTAKIQPPVDDDPPGTFRAMVSVYGVKDHHGDVVEAGAFEKTLHEWALKGRPVPVVWSHGYDDLDNFIGKFTDMVETDKGFELVGQLDLNTARGARVHELMKDGIITEFSWSGLVREYEFLDDDDDDDFGWFMGLKILDVDLWEAGPCFKGSNPDTELISIKSNGVVRGAVTAAKAGRVLAKHNYDALVKARDEISRVLESAQVEESDPDDAEADPADEAEKQVTNDIDVEPAKMVTEPEAKDVSGEHVRALLELIAISQRKES